MNVSAVAEDHHPKGRGLFLVTMEEVEGRSLMFLFVSIVILLLKPCHTLKIGNTAQVNVVMISGSLELEQTTLFTTAKSTHAKFAGLLFW
jgi:hypothetical protein